ncbi:site-specific tyrosine recombinase [Aquihabitans sp. McL0605]|uniref:site-specific tyrosine recombinase n=1 Tax=Aquihabitans sp. McL0605 TaxID=3415671 RepID=UPI003CF73079
MNTHDLPVEVDDFLLSMRVERGRSTNTLNAYANDLRGYVAWLDDHGLTVGEVTEPVITEYVNHLRASDRAPSTVKRTLVSVRGLHRFLAEETEGVADPTVDVEVPKAPKGLPKALSEAEVQLLLDSVTGTDAIARRDRAIVEVLYGTGIRIAELSGMSRSDLDLDAGLLRVFGKGAKERIVPLGRYAVVALVDWLGPQGRPLLEPERWARRDDADAVFLNRRGGRLQRQGAWLVVRTAADRCGLGSRLTPHVLRHSYATHMLDHGADVRTVQELLGHASIATTQVYTKVSGERLQSVYRTAHPRASAG